MYVDIYQHLPHVRTSTSIRLTTARPETRHAGREQTDRRRKDSHIGA